MQIQAAPNGLRLLCFFFLKKATNIKTVHEVKLNFLKKEYWVEEGKRRWRGWNRGVYYLHIGIFSRIFSKYFVCFPNN